MSNKNRKLTLLFKANVAIIMQPLNFEEEKLIEQLLGDVAAEKNKVPCG
jgi:hypothetical protein